MLVASSIVLGTGCGDDATSNGRQARPTKRTSTPAREAPRRCGAEGAAGARVMLDVSQSMRGFARPGSAVFESVHRAVDEAVAEAGAAQPLVRCEVGTSVTCPSRRSHAELREPSTYGADHARLDLAIRRPPAGDDAASRDPLDHHRLAVLVTDGMQSSPAGARPPADSDEACLAGADPRCLRALFARRVSEGYGVWLGVLLLPFRGDHFAERGIDPTVIARVSEHLAEAQRRRPYHETPLRVLPRSTRTTSYGYEGLKPLLFIAFSCDTETGRRFVDGLGRALAAARVVTEGDGRWNAAQLAPLDAPTRAIATVRRQDATGLEMARPRRAATGRITAEVTCEASGRGRLRIGTRSTGSDPPPYVIEHVSLTALGRPLARTALSAPNRDGASDWTMDLRCLRLAAREHRTELELSSRYTFDAARVDPETFWRKLSAPNAFEMPERAYALDELANGVVEAAARRVRRWGRVEIRIDRR
ncbi:MAG: hypothetical protein IT379_25885 [Deltaproteobacteria bacterium]|nr:hypothetical protein [Deltaproteobacteria bacterium]